VRGSLGKGKGKGPHGGAPVDDDDAGITVVATGDALAVGEDTETWISADLKVRTFGEVTIVKGEVTAWAAAEGSDDDFLFASAESDALVAGADFVRMVERDLSGGDATSTYQLSTTKVFAIDRPGGGGSKFLARSTRGEIDRDIDLDGNRAGVKFTTEASGNDTLAQVDSYALAIEDTLSQSSILAVASAE